MKVSKKVLLFLVTLFLVVIFGENKVRAESSLYLNSLEFNVKINEDASINITEYWNIDIEETNTLYKTFKTDNTKYSGITDVKVSEITEGRKTTFKEQDEWEYHVDSGKYYGTKNKKGDFEIGWGVGLDNSYDTRKYKIEYKVQNAITKYSDYSQLYWQLVGEDFEISAEQVKGTITLPEKASSKEDIKVWGHIDTLNGTIYATDLDKIEFEVNGYRSNRMLEVRILFPTGMIKEASRTHNIEILQTVIDEETKWVEEANARRDKIKNTITTIIVIAGAILDFAFIITIIGANKNPIRKQKKFIPEQKMEYYRDIPRNNASPGEAVNLLQKNITDLPNYDSLGKIFSAVLLNLKLKGYLDFEIDEDKKNKEKISIKMGKKANAEELNSEEKEIYAFLDQATLRKEERKLTLKELQKEIKSKPKKIEKLGKNIGENIYAGLIKEKLLDKEQAKIHSDTTGVIAVQIIFLILFLFFAIIMPLETGYTKGIVITIITTTVLGIISIGKKIAIFKRINAFTQQGVNEIEQWKGLKKYMEDFSLLDEKEVLHIEIWEKFLVYATAFGIAEKVIKQLKLVYPNIDEITDTNYTMMYLMMHTDFSSSFSSAITSSISSTYSSATGGGGGFSGGGGGGGGRRWRRRTLKN